MVKATIQDLQFARHTQQAVALSLKMVVEIEDDIYKNRLIITFILHFILNVFISNNLDDQEAALLFLLQSTILPISP